LVSQLRTLILKSLSKATLYDFKSVVFTFNCSKFKSLFSFVSLV
jgi:hypothetical protein